MSKCLSITGVCLAVTACGPAGSNLDLSSAMGTARSGILAFSTGDVYEVRAFESSDLPVLSPLATDTLQLALWTYDVPLARLGLEAGLLKDVSDRPCALPPPKELWAFERTSLEPATLDATRRTFASVTLPYWNGNCCPLDSACDGCTRFSVEARPLPQKPYSFGTIIPLAEDVALIRYASHDLIVGPDGPLAMEASNGPFNHGFVRGTKAYGAQNSTLFELETTDALARFERGEPVGAAWVPIAQTATSAPIGDIAGPTRLDEPLEIFSLSHPKATFERSTGDVLRWTPEAGFQKLADFAPDTFGKILRRGPGVAIVTPAARLFDAAIEVKADTSVSEIPVLWTGGASSAYLLDAKVLPSLGPTLMAASPSFSYLVSLAEGDDAFRVVLEGRKPDTREGGTLAETPNYVLGLGVGGFAQVLVSEELVCPTILVAPELQLTGAVELRGRIIIAGNSAEETLVIATPIPDPE